MKLNLKSLKYRVLFFFLTSAAAAYAQNIYIPAVSGSEKDIVNVPIMVKDAPNAVDTFYFEVSYDNTRLAYKGYDTTKTLLENSWTPVINGKLNDHTIAAAGVDVGGGFKANTSGTLIVLKFEMLSGACSAPSKYSKFTLQNLGSGITGWKAGNGSFMCISSTLGLSMYMPNVKGNEGESITVPIMVENAPNNVHSFGVDMHFDSSRLEYKGYSKVGALIEHFTMAQANLDQEGIVKVGGYDLNGFSTGTSGTLIALMFEVKQNEFKVDPSPFTLENLVDDFKNWTTSSGSFSYDISVPSLNRCGIFVLFATFLAGYRKTKKYEYA